MIKKQKKHTWNSLEFLSVFFLDESFRKLAIVHKLTRGIVVITLARNLRQFPIIFFYNWNKRQDFVICNYDKRFASAKIFKNIFQHLGGNMLTSVFFNNKKSTNFLFCVNFFQRSYASNVIINCTNNNFASTIKNSWEIFGPIPLKILWIILAKTICYRISILCKFTKKLEKRDF